MPKEYCIIAILINFFFLVHIHIIVFSFIHTILARYYVRFDIDIIVFKLQVN